MIQQQQIRVWRARLALSQAELATAVGINQTRISRAENGLTRLSDAEMLTITTFLRRKRLETSRKKVLA